MKNNIQKDNNPQPKPLTLEQLQSVKGGSGTAAAEVVQNDIML